MYCNAEDFLYWHESDLTCFLFEIESFGLLLIMGHLGVKRLLELVSVQKVPAFVSVFLFFFQLKKCFCFTSIFVIFSKITPFHFSYLLKTEYNFLCSNDLTASESQSPFAGCCCWALNIFYKKDDSFCCKVYCERYIFNLCIWYLAGICPRSRYTICIGIWITDFSWKIFGIWSSSILSRAHTSFSGLL